jgi:excisionase family DNA binding protein
MKPLHDVRDGARLLAISPWTVRLYVRQGRLRPVRIGTRVLLEDSEVERFVVEARSGSSATQIQNNGEENTESCPQ